MLFITGDTHADPTLVRIETYAKKREVLLKSPRTDPNEVSHLLVAGDFGYCWRGIKGLLDELSTSLKKLNTS